MRITTLCLALALSLCGCTHSHLGIGLGTFDDPDLTHLSGVSADDEALGGSDHLLLDFDEVPVMDLAVFRGKGVSGVAVWPGSGHGWRLEWRGESGFALLVRAEEQVSLRGGASGMSLPLSDEVAILLQADGSVLRRVGDAKNGTWVPGCRGVPNQREAPAHGHGHSHGEGGHHH